MIAFLSRWEKLWKVDRYDKINYIHILSRVFTILKIIMLSKTIFLKSDCVDLLDRSRSIQKVNCFLFELILITPINYIDLLDRHLFFFFFFFCLFWLPTHRAEPLFLKIFFSHSTSGPTHGPTLLTFSLISIQRSRVGPPCLFSWKCRDHPSTIFSVIVIGGHQVSLPAF